MKSFVSIRNAEFKLKVSVGGVWGVRGASSAGEVHCMTCGFAALLLSLFSTVFFYFSSLSLSLFLVSLLSILFSIAAFLLPVLTARLVF